MSATQETTPAPEPAQADSNTESVPADKKPTTVDVTKELEAIGTKLKTVSVSTELQQLLDSDPELKKEYEELQKVTLLNQVAQQQEIFNRDNLALLKELLKGLQELTDRHPHHGEDDEEMEDIEELVHFVA